MSVTVIAHFPVADVKKAIAGLQANAALLEEITEDSKGGGIIHHTFVAGEGELVVIDEWKTAEQFQSFFEGNAKIAKVTEIIGVTALPPSRYTTKLRRPARYSRMGRTGPSVGRSVSWHVVPDPDPTQQRRSA